MGGRTVIRALADDGLNFIILRRCCAGIFKTNLRHRKGFAFVLLAHCDICKERLRFEGLFIINLRVKELRTIIY